MAAAGGAEACSRGRHDSGRRLTPKRGRPARLRMQSGDTGEERMSLGYDGRLYILSFDHRGSFQKKMFGIQGHPTPDQTETVADAKHLIFEGMVKAVDRGGVDPQVEGMLVDEQFGAPRDIPRQAKELDIKLAMPVEKSGQDVFDFEYGEDFGRHILEFDPDFSK